MNPFTKLAKNWNSPDFENSLKHIVESLDPTQKLLHGPLQQGLSHGDYVAEDKIKAMIIKVAMIDKMIEAKLGIFYTSLLTGCHCSDDPTPDNVYNEYCELQFVINPEDDHIQVTLL
jgi:hypothetical protein